jgi:FKBP-type peptidyl-prolyl cis-trans isomerase
MASKQGSKRAKTKKVANKGKTAKAKHAEVKTESKKPETSAKLNSAKTGVSSVAGKISEKMKSIKPAQFKHGFRFVFKWVAITAIVFFFVGGPVLAAWMSNKDTQQKQKEQEESLKQYEEAVKKAQEEAANKPKEYDESLRYAGEITSLQIVDEKTGDGAEAQAGNTVKVKYKGALAVDGQVFDQSDEGIDIGLDQVIEGWKEGVPGMKVGGVRILRIPADKAYGEQANASIPGNSNLVFRIELLEVNPAAPESQ